MLLGALALAGCASQAPDSYQAYMRNQSGGTGGYAQGPAAAPAPQGFTTEGALDAINSAGSTPSAAAAPLPYGERPRGNAPTNIRPEIGEMAGVAGHTGISNENSFEAVSAQRSIAEDAAVIAQNRSQYVQVQPTAVPSRPNDNTPNIVSYALQQNHARGQQMYGRSSVRFSNAQQQCAQYLSADLAQEAFLASGGPQRDRNNLDPDGDGYACAWDPAPFRAAAAR
ncbi:hypothetical protein [Falsirhodobacter sp. 20TX0035]|uniref:hypothetical protein n=1 Tax=Falsirhodobacter sp. 20TX0035 TaxID=3022019 RepID=UPI00232B4821|nr:hypothetical protein [Falsirhodobacter sp. 20TX0035]MDB6455067.1 hypothetical protein [Falsirhodobacter sp. 20TX0035]